MPYVAGADRDQGLTEPDRRCAASSRRRSSERDELGFGILVALLLAADLLRRPVMEDRPVRQELQRPRGSTASAYTVFDAA
ncbi:hypothetical protein ACFVY1_26120 [Streptomyces sp. NPDC058293]|uniref:hypothetical protein n=1 Tax=Streptomyces sp. NPDC058293 TaxID=3346429 RepID=UPI0036E61296